MERLVSSKGFFVLLAAVIPILLFILTALGFISIKKQFESVSSSLGRVNIDAANPGGFSAASYVYLGVKERNIELGEVDLPTGRYLIRNDVVLKVLDLNSVFPVIRNVMVGYSLNNNSHVFIGGPVYSGSEMEAARSGILNYYKMVKTGTIVQLFTANDPERFFDSVFKSRGNDYRSDVTASLVIGLQRLASGRDKHGVLVAAPPSFREQIIKLGILTPWLRLF